MAAKAAATTNTARSGGAAARRRRVSIARGQKLAANVDIRIAVIWSDVYHNTLVGVNAGAYVVLVVPVMALGEGVVQRRSRLEVDWVPRFGNGGDCERLRGVGDRVCNRHVVVASPVDETSVR